MNIRNVNPNIHGIGSWKTPVASEKSIRRAEGAEGMDGFIVRSEDLTVHRQET
jgi:hypothetical protein